MWASWTRFPVALDASTTLDMTSACRGVSLRSRSVGEARMLRRSAIATRSGAGG